MIKISVNESHIMTLKFYLFSNTRVRLKRKELTKKSGTSIQLMLCQLGGKKLSKKLYNNLFNIKQFEIRTIAFKSKRLIALSR